MNKAARMIAMSGMAAVAALGFSAGPAAAASASPAPSASKASTQTADKHGPFQAKVVGYYRSPTACHRAGRLGEWRNRWEDHTCSRVAFGFKRGWWALQVRFDNHGGFPGQGHGFPPGKPHGQLVPGGPNHPTKK